MQVAHAAGASHPRARSLALIAAWLLVAATTSHAASFGVPTPLDPPGYFILTGPDVPLSFGDKTHSQDFWIEVTGALPLDVSIYDPGLNDGVAADGLDASFGAPATNVTYTLFDPGGTPIATRSFGADDLTTDKTLVSLFNAVVSGGLYRLNATMTDDINPAVMDSDVNVFGVSVPGYDFYTHHFTGGHVNLNSATISEPLWLYPWVPRSTPGDFMGEDVTGIDVISYDLNSTAGVAPPFQRIETVSGRGADLTPSLDSQQFTTQLRGLDPGPANCSDYGIFTIENRDLGLVLEQGAFDLNIFSEQVAGYLADIPAADFPVAKGDPRDPKRIYYPRDDGSAPVKEAMNHTAVVISGPDPPQATVPSTFQVTLTIDNPGAYDMTGIVATTRMTVDTQFTDPTNVMATGGLVAIATGRDISITGMVPAGTTGTVTYETDFTALVPGPSFYMTGDGTDLQGGARTTEGTYLTPFADPLSPEMLGPICMLRAEALTPMCFINAALTGNTCIGAGESADLDASGTTFAVCAGGLEYRWLADGLLIPGFDWGAPDMITVSPVSDTVYTVEVRCASLPPCTDSQDFTVLVGAGPVPPDVGNTLLAAREGVDDVHLYWTDNGTAEYRVRFMDPAGDKTLLGNWLVNSLLRDTVAATDYLMPAAIPNGVDPSYYEVFAFDCAESLDLTDPGEGAIVVAPARFERPVGQPGPLVAPAVERPLTEATSCGKALSRP